MHRQTRNTQRDTHSGILQYIHTHTYTHATTCVLLKIIKQLIHTCTTHVTHTHIHTLVGGGCRIGLG